MKEMKELNRVDPKPRVVIESPYKGHDQEEIDIHEGYLAECIQDSIGRGEAPMASHGFYTKYLNDDDPVDRKVGMECGFRWGTAGDLVAVYVDFDISDGMQEGIDFYRLAGLPIEYRTLPIDITKNRPEMGKPRWKIS